MARPQWIQIVESQLREWQRKLEAAEAVAKLAESQREENRLRAEALERDLADASRRLDELREQILKHVRDKPECHGAFEAEQALAS
jgi:chromosome segregation ATPase